MKRKVQRTICILSALLVCVLSAQPAQAVVNGIFLGSDENGVNILNDTLIPGEEYYLPVLVAVDGAPPAQLTAQDVERNRLRVRVSTGSEAVASVEVAERGGLAYIRLIPGGKGTTQTLRATLRLNYQSADSGENLTVLPQIQVGYRVMDDSKLSELEPGEYLEPDNSAPIVTPQQWKALSELNDYRDATLTGPGWRFTVNVSGVGKRNMLATHEPVPELVRQLGDRELHFVSFPGEPDFGAKGKLVLDVSAIAEDYGYDFFVYRYAYGKLYPLTYEYDKDAAELSFRPSQLSTYLITDRRVSLEDNEPESDLDNTVPPTQNPETGAVQSAGWRVLAALAALASSAGLGLLTASKRRP